MTKPYESACIRIKNLRLRTYIGFNNEEKLKKQDVVINACIWYNAAAAAERDEVDKALDYKGITKKIIAHVENNQFLLLEKLTHDILHIALEPSQAIRAEVEVDKPHALRFADSVSLTLTAKRP